MTDDELRDALSRAHADDAAPPMAKLLARPRPRPRRRAWLLLLPAAAAIVLALLLLRPSRPARSLASLGVTWTAPTDFLLDVPGRDLLRGTPAFELKGPLP